MEKADDAFRCYSETGCFSSKLRVLMNLNVGTRCSKEVSFKHVDICLGVVVAVGNSFDCNIT